MDDSKVVHLVDYNTGGSYKFLSISDVSLVKEVLCSKYIARLREICSSRMSGKNKAAATNIDPAQAREKLHDRTTFEV